MQKFSPGHFSVITHFTSFPDLLPETWQTIGEKAVFKQALDNSCAICYVSGPFLDSNECFGHVQQILFHHHHADRY
jgi:hypothetical protein